MTFFYPPLGLSIFCGSRDQHRPGSFLNKREEPGNEVVNREELNKGLPRVLNLPIF